MQLNKSQYDKLYRPVSWGIAWLTLVEVLMLLGIGSVCSQVLLVLLHHTLVWLHWVRQR